MTHIFLQALDIIYYVVDVIVCISDCIVCLVLQPLVLVAS